MPVPDIDEVKRLLAEFEPRIRNVIEASWREWLAYPNKGRVVFMGRFRQFTSLTLLLVTH